MKFDLEEVNFSHRRQMFIEEMHSYDSDGVEWKHNIVFL
jgi:hypothetical protein